MRAIFDSILAILLVVLEAPQLTAIPLHEVLGAFIAALLLFHLLLHRNLFVERRRLHAALNFALFVAVLLTIVSGFAISKWVLPVAHTPGGYLTWRGIHDTSSRWAVLFAGLHVGMNWRRLWNGLPLRPIARRLAPVSLLIAVAIGATLAIAALRTFAVRCSSRSRAMFAGGGTRLRFPSRVMRVIVFTGGRRGLPPLGAMSILFVLSAGVSAAILRRR